MRPQEHSQSPDLHAQPAEGQAYAKRTNRMMGNQGIISSQFSFEDGEMMICSSGPWTTKEETKELRAHLGQAKMDKVVSQVVQRVGGFRRIAEGFGGAQQQQ